ncbi:RnfABCDGE type electron transport complex subunit G [candidate division WOR-3 bacterium]|uniref:Ion-translocating oxidoreductase complex subunit G n=1 Tax=candidate division WOR-3 bacterium TaxID=2052148 RepID=A0A9D5QCX7_UNCW3|nr:RnfABCDGE type electron transport complex subunit G [candidate division WOR-3 bacterium]MBD3365143.1 RnfABCDGE type electron transport complex subunit G [candidate division WOR-3 bacterium]
MKLEFKMILVMLGVVVVSGGLLAVVYSFTSDIIVENEEEKRQEALIELLPEADTAGFKEDSIIAEDTSVIYHAYDEVGKKVGLVFTVAPKGFAGPIVTMVGLRTDTTVSGILVISMSETPGLGAAVTDTSFSNQYKGLKPDEIFLSSAGGEIDAITASTISSNALTSGVREGVERYTPYLTLESGEKPSSPEATRDSTETDLRETSQESVEDNLDKKVVPQAGFVDEFTVVVFLDSDGAIAGVEIPEEDFSETPGYGDKCLSSTFLDRFKGLKTPQGVLSVDAITGATSTSDSIKAAVARAFER